jgi:TolA-binding protein
MDQQVNIDLIEQYLNQELTEKEKLDFENQIQKDQTLAAEFERRQTAHKMLDFMIGENLRSQLKSLEAQEAKVVTLAPRKRRIYTLAIAASVIILIGAFFFLIPGGGSLSNPQLALEYYQSPAYTMRGGNNETINANISQGIDALKAGNFSEATADLSKVPAADPYFVLAQYYLGHAQFSVKNYQAAMASFENVIKSGDIRYTEDATWYQFLSCLAQDGSCQSYLNNLLGNPNHSYYQKALSIQEAQSK